MKQVNLGFYRMVLFLLLGLFTSVIAYSQQISVKGIVKDQIGEPVIGANVLVRGTTNGVITNVNGEFILSASKSDVLVVSFVGYTTQEIPVSEKQMTIVLKEDTELLDEVVVLGYGANTRKQDLSASVGIISNTDELAARPVTSTESMLQGQLPGVTIQADGGDPTSTPNIVIRGQGSQNGDNVLWVVDGVPGAPITSMNDIESIVVLKDAASAAIYGAQSGAGGVVLVTTKKAKEGAPTLTYDGTFGFRQATNLIEPLNAEEQVEMRRRSYENAGQALPDGWNVTKNPWVGTTRTDWMDAIFRTAFYQRHNIALNVGTDKSSSRLSLSFDNDQGTLINTYKKNLALRYNGKMQLNKWITISEDLVWKNTTSRSKETDNDAYTGPILSAVYMPASATIYNPLDGSYGGTTTEDPAYIEKYGSNFADAHGDAVNPVRLLEAENLYNKTSDVWSTTSLEIGMYPGLKFVSRFTYNLQNYYYKKFNPIRDEVGKPNLSNNVQEQSYRMDAWKTENTLTYDNTFGKHTVGALFSTTADHYSKRGLEAIGKDLSSEAAYLQYMAYANSTEVLDYLTGPDANVSMIARLAYSYDDRYFVTASWRRDYAGRLPKEHNFGDFPAVTLGWKISNEKFFKKNDIVNLLKLRASWGRVGNLGSIDYNYKSPLLSKNTYSEQAQYGVTSNQLWNNFAYYSTALNPNLTWETSEQYDLGLDMEMFNNRLSLSMDYFDKRTFNLIQPQPMNWPSTMGLDAMLVNLGEVRNRGFELSIGWNDRINKNFSYFVTGNFSYLKNWVSDIGVKNEDGTPGVWTDDKSFRSVKDIYQTTEGEPLNSFHLIQTAGIFQSDEEAAAYVDKNGKRIQPDAKKGDLKFVDYDGDGTIGFGDRQYMGSATPKTTFAWTLGFTWKKLSFSAMFQGVGGAQAMNVSKYMLLSDVEGNFNRSREILNAWSPDNRGSNIPILSKNDNNGNFSTASDWYLEDASYLRLKNVTLSYDLSDVFCKWSHLNDRNSRLSVFLSGENLATITRYSGMDPECGGWDALKYPVSRVFSLGVKLTY